MNDTAAIEKETPHEVQTTTMEEKNDEEAPHVRSPPLRRRNDSTPKIVWFKKNRLILVNTYNVTCMKIQNETLQLVLCCVVGNGEIERTLRNYNKNTMT